MDHYCGGTTRTERRLIRMPTGPIAVWVNAEVCPCGKELLAVHSVECIERGEPEPPPPWMATTAVGLVSMAGTWRG